MLLEKAISQKKVLQYTQAILPLSLTNPDC